MPLNKNETQKVTMENVLSPAHVVRVDADEYEAVKAAILAVIPEQAPGVTGVELRQAVIPNLSGELFPEGAKAGWWIKGVQLDLEAKGAIAREATKPLRFYKNPR